MYEDVVYVCTRILYFLKLLILIGNYGCIQTHIVEAKW